MSDWPALKNPVPPHLREYLDATLANLKPAPEGKLLPAWRTPQGWLCIQYPWLSVEGYDFEKACEGQSDQDIRRAYCLDWHASTGKKVLTEFSLTFHVAREVLPFYPDEPLYVGWDMPGTPACSILQLNGYGQLCLLSSLSPREEETIGVYDFGARVAEHLLRCYARPNDMDLSDLRLLHYGDPAGFNRPIRTGQQANEAEEVRSCFEILDQGEKVFLGHDKAGRPVYEERPGWRWRVLPGKKGITERVEALRARLRVTVGAGLPAFVICKSATDAIDAFAGYHYKERADGTYEPDPAKTWESHTVDSVAYVVTMLHTAPKKKGDHAPVREPVVSRAATKSRGR